MLQKLLLAGVERRYTLLACLLALTALAGWGVTKVPIDTGPHPAEEIFVTRP